MFVVVLKKWILASFVVTGVCGTIYWTVQQSLRQSAYDPQIQMAEDTATLLNNGKFQPGPTNLYPIDISKSLSPFLIVYDSRGNVISSDAILNGQTPKMASGVFDWVAVHGEDRFTWQPQNDTRIGTIVVPFKSDKMSGFVVAGRNMREVEWRIERDGIEVAMGWAATVFGSLVVIGILEAIFSQKKK